MHLSVKQMFSLIVLETEETRSSDPRISMVTDLCLVVIYARHIVSGNLVY